MLITRSAFSCASAWKGNRPRETMRSHGGEVGWFPTDNERVSPNTSEPDSASLRQCRLINLPEMVKSATVGDETCVDTHWIDRGGWGERALKEQRQVPGDPHWQDSPCSVIKALRGAAEIRNLLIAVICYTLRSQLRNQGYRTRICLNGSRESITWIRPLRKSDRPVVARKWGNSHGAKGPSFSCVSIKIRRSA